MRGVDKCKQWKLRRFGSDMMVCRSENMLTTKDDDVRKDLETSIPSQTAMKRILSTKCSPQIKRARVMVSR